MANVSRVETSLGARLVIEDANDLPDAHKRCLRLVARGMTSKEMAPLVGLSPGTIDVYMQDAIKRLGASNRRDAARKFSELDQLGESQLRSEALAAPAAPSEKGHASKQPDEPQKGKITSWLRPPPLGGKVNTLSKWDRIFEMFRAALFIVAVTAGLVLLFYGTLLVLK